MRRLIAIAIIAVASWSAPHPVIAAEDARLEPAPADDSGVWPPFPDTDGVAVDALPEAEVEPPTVNFELLGMRIAPGERVTLDLELSESFTGGAVVTPVQVVRGDQPGSVLCLVAGLHGDEVVGIEVVRRVVSRIEPVGMNGTVVAVPVANPVGFRRLSRYLPDRRDLNRHFPGRSYGSSASRMAYRIFEGVIRHCDVLVDFHSGSFHRANLPQVRADLDNPILLAISGWFGAPVVVDSPGAEGTLRYAAVQAGIDALLYEAGEPMRFDEGSVETGVQGVLSLMKAMQMAEYEGSPPNVSEFFRGSHWVRSDSGGIFLAEVQLGAWVKQGQVLGSVTSPFTNERRDVRARETGRVIGRAVDQVVSPGYALFHVGTIEAKPFANDEEPVERGQTEPLERDERPE